MKKFKENKQYVFSAKKCLRDIGIKNDGNPMTWYNICDGEVVRPTTPFRGVCLIYTIFLEWCVIDKPKRFKNWIIRNRKIK